LKKRSKKLLIPVGFDYGIAYARRKQKFLVLFFKKEPLPFLPIDATSYFSAYSARASSIR
jgi:hypothetical protein